MALSPLPIILLISSTLTFEAVLYGGEVAGSTIPNIYNPEPGDCDGFLDGIACAIKYVFSFFAVLFGVVLFVLSLIIFDVPGAPFFVRIPISIVMISGITWSVATLIRGN